MKTQSDTDTYVSGLLAGDRAALARTLTLVESTRDDHRLQAEEILDQLIPKTGNSIRVGISGAPGTGKSTFIESLGMHLIAAGKKVAVLAVDPSSELSGGSVLGDKTRMERLSNEPNAFIRPTPSALALGGVAHGTRESILVCEAAGFDVVLVETVGVGQSETHVASMVDFFLLLMIAGAGDELQSIKRGIVELVDAIAINKSDGDNANSAAQTRAQFEAALRLLRANGEWQPPVVTCSALTGVGVSAIWELIADHSRTQQANGQWAARRKEQSARWLRQALEQMALENLQRAENWAERWQSARADVVEGRILPTRAARGLLGLS